MVVGNPINSVTGNKFADEADYRATGLSPLQFTRHYNSFIVYQYQITFGTAGITSNPIGIKWSHNYYQGLTVSSTEVKLTLSSGQTFLFRPVSGTWQADADVDYRLEEILTASVRTGWKVTAPDDTVETYNAIGDLLSIADIKGPAQTLSYSCKTVSATCPVVTPPAVAPYAGLLIGVTDSFDHSLNFTYDSNGRISTMADPAGNITRYGYDATGNLATVTHPDGTPDDTDNPKKTYVYGELPYTANISQPYALTGIIDENNVRYATYQYDANGRAISTEHATGGINKYKLAYNPDGSTSVTDPLETVRTTRFTTVLGVVKSTGSDQPPGAGCAAAASHIGYDANGNIASRTDFNGNTTCYAYDPARNLETVRLEGLAPGRSCPDNLGGYTPAADTAERKITTEWHPVWRVPTRIAEPKRLTKLDWGDSASQCGSQGVLCGKTLQATNDSTGNLGTAAPPVGAPRSWNYSYNSRGQILAQDGPRNAADVIDRTTYTYYPDDAAVVNNRKLLKTITDSAARMTTYNGYDAHGHPTQIIAANGVVTDLGYTPRSQLQTLTVAGRTTRFDYYPNGLPWKITTPDTGTTRYGYDDAQRLRSITNAAGEKIAYSLDNLDDRTQDSIYASGAETPSTVAKRRFDPLGRLRRQLNTANQIIREYNYDAQGNLGSSIGQPDALAANNQITDYSGYDALNRLTGITDAINGLAQYRYDGQDHLAQVKDPRNNTTTYITSGLDNPIQEDSPDRGLVKSTLFDPAGNLKTGIDARGNAATYSYDSLNRLLAARYHPTDTSPDVALNYRYDGRPSPANPYAHGQLTHIDDPTGATDWAYDSEGRLQSKTQSTAALLRRVSYSYDPATGRIDTVTYPAGGIVKYGYDSAGRPNKLSYAANASAPFTTLLDTIAYQPLGPANRYRLAAVTGTPIISRHFDSDGHIDRYTLNDADKKLSYDRLGNVTTLGDVGTTANDQTYSYDQLNRLTDFWAPGINQHYDYDAGGNRTVKINNGITTAYLPETASNRLDTVNTTPYNYDQTGNLTGNGTLTFGYDSRNRLTYARTASGIEYSYGINALGQRVSKTSAALATGGRVFVYDEVGHLIGEYDNTGLRIQEHIWLGDQPVAVIAGGGGGLYYVLSDHLNTPRQLIDGSNRLRWRWDNLDPFGANAQNPNPLGLGLFGINLRFPGQYADAETGMIYNYSRIYDQKGGRYTQSDPIGLRGGLNTYGYVRNNPLRWIDPKGLTSLYYDSASQILSVYPEQPGKSSYYISATSGRPNCDGCNASTPNVGPIPSGNYTLNAQNISNPNVIGDLLRNLPGIGADWGDWRGRLIPNQGTNTFGRSGFYLHGGSIRGSAGCIDVGGGMLGNSSTTRLLNEIISDPDGIIPVAVK